MKRLVIGALALLFFLPAMTGHTTNTEDMSTNQNLKMLIGEAKAKADTDQHRRIERGLQQAFSFWREEDGTFDEFRQFCLEHSAQNSAQRQALFLRIQDNLELLFGSFNKISVGLKIPLHVDEGEILPVDRIFGGYGAENIDV